MKFRLFGIEFEISFLFTALLAVITATDKTGDIYLFFAAAAVHEAAHLLVMICVDAKPKAVRLIPGGINIVDKTQKTSFEDIVILAAGPIANLTCFLIFKGDFCVLNLLLFIYNMLPVRGLDGGRIIQMILSYFLSFKTAEVFLNIITVLIGASFAAAFVWLYIRGTENYSVLIFSLYIISTVFLKKGVERKR